MPLGGNYSALSALAKGQWEPVCNLYGDASDELGDGRGELFALEPSGYFEEHYQPSPDAWLMESVGKKKAGRVLDGREWNEYPGNA